MQEAILVRLRDDLTGDELYERTRKEWKMSEKKLENIEFAFSLHKGVIKEVYSVKLWYPIPDRKRFGFKGNLAESSIREKYIGKDLSSWFKKGSANPIRYTSLEELDNSFDQDIKEPPYETVIDFDLFNEVMIWVDEIDIKEALSLNDPDKLIEFYNDKMDMESLQFFNISDDPIFSEENNIDNYKMTIGEKSIKVKYKDKSKQTLPQRGKVKFVMWRILDSSDISSSEEVDITRLKEIHCILDSSSEISMNVMEDNIFSEIKAIYKDNTEGNIFVESESWGSPIAAEIRMINSEGSINSISMFDDPDELMEDFEYFLNDSK